MNVQNTTYGHRTSCELTRCAFPCDLTPAFRRSGSRRAQADAWRPVLIVPHHYRRCQPFPRACPAGLAHQSLRPIPASMCTRLGVVSVPGPGRQSTTFTSPGSTISQPVKNSMNCSRDLATAGVCALW